MYYATLTDNLEPVYSYGYPKISEEIIAQLSADLDKVLRLIQESKGKERWKLEGVAEALSYVLEISEK